MSPKCEAFVELMLAAAKRVRAERGTSEDEVVLFCPQYVVASLLGVDPSTIRRWFYRYPQLKKRVNMAYHCAEMENGRRMKDGCLWVVSLEGSDRPLRFPPEAFAVQVRDFVADIESGRTLHGPSTQEPEGAVETLCRWTFQDFPPPTEVGPCSVPEAVDNAVMEPARIPASASFLARSLRDRGGERFWMKQLWRVVRGDLFRNSLVLAVERALADVADGYPRHAPALVNARIHNRTRSVAMR